MSNKKNEPDDPKVVMESGEKLPLSMKLSGVTTEYFQEPIFDGEKIVEGSALKNNTENE